MESNIASLWYNRQAPAFRWGGFISGRVIFLAFFICFAISLRAQEREYDLLVKRDGTILEVTIVEDKSDEILYRKKEAPDGPIYAILKSELLSVRYRKGETATFTVTVDNFYERKEAGAVQPPFEKPIYQPLPPRNEFEKRILDLPSGQLGSEFSYYRGLSRAGRRMGFWAIALQVGINLTGTLIISSNTYTDSFGNTISTNDNAVRTGSMMLVAGSLGGAVLGTTGFIRAAKNGNKAKYIRSEMRRRGLPPPVTR